MPGPEFTVGVLGTGTSARVLGVMEIAPKQARQDEFVYSLEVKRDWEQQVEYLVPPRRPAALLQRAQQVALDAYRALGCRDISRVDLRTDAAGEPRFLEVNPLPGINPVTGDIVILAGKMSMGYQQLIGSIVDAARSRLSL